MELAGAVVQALTEQVVQGVGKEAHYALGFGGHFDQTKKILEVAKKFLENKDVINHKLKEGHAKPALIQLRKLIYEADDVVTDCLMRREYKDDGLRGFLDRCDLIFLHQAGKKLNKINSEMQQNLKDLGAYDIPESQSRTEDGHHSQNEERILASQDFNPNEIIGLEDAIKKLKGWIDERDKGLQCIAIAGMGGLGKTTIAQQIYNDTEIQKVFQTIWVTVSRNYQEDVISAKLLTKLGGGTSDRSHLFKALSDARKIKKDANYLVVMDDVWSIDDIEWWDNIRSALTIQNGRTCIIVTTRDEGVAGQVVSEASRIHRPELLDKEKSWRLFTKFAFRSTEGKCESQGFEEKGREILDKCGGLPLSIKTIGSLLASKKDLSIWTQVSESFHDRLAVLGVKDDKVKASLALSYGELEAHLQQCLLCLSIYPEDHAIRAEQIIHWWVAEGLVSRQGSNKSVVELGYQYLSALVSRCLVEVDRRRNYDGKVYTCKVHDVVRELIMEIAKSESFCAFNEKGIQVWEKDSYWLGFVDEMIGNINSFGNNSKLRSLVLVTSSPIEISPNWGFPLSLRMLDLSGGCTNLDEKRVKNLLDWIASLERLACLNLSEVKSLEELPSSVCKLRNLQMLILTGCRKLKKLPSSITRMKKLTVLHLGGCSLEYLPRGLGRLSGLQDLTGFRLVSKQNAKACDLHELSKLIQLRELQMVISNDDFEILESELNEVLSELKNLKVLDIDASECQRPKALKMVDCLYPPKGIKELYLRNYQCKAMPKWIHPSTLPKLQYLCVEDGDVSSFIPQVEIVRSEYVWKELEGLSLKNLGKLFGDWQEFEKVMPERKYIEVSPYVQWKNLPQEAKESGIWRKN
ncbi:Disease resistance RPP13-like protein 4 [Morus notabilis]|uniref:Disease resistance RPP13-like protein 4 n=1 Tax=Morus notabilis TaxID=981085 RepID=W9QMC5_9ROSA|nr:disease resistance RPP13-like protein 4 [Morus notabilis]EXB41595.1 Disease resistance RPP13-like protein 4 [Morus notabilis]